MISLQPTSQVTRCPLLVTLKKVQGSEMLILHCGKQIRNPLQPIQERRNLYLRKKPKKTQFSLQSDR